MSKAFEESPTSEPVREPETGLAAEAGLASEPEADVASAAGVGTESQAAGGPDGRDGADGDSSSSRENDGLSGLEALLSDDFARISAERDEYLDSLQRLQADFNNFRKRTERHQTELRDRANEVLLTRLLPVLDALDLALAHLGLREAAPADEASASLVQVNTVLRDTLQREGLERIDAVGVPFDPTIHDATAMDDGAPAADGTADDSAPSNSADAGADDAPTGPTVADVWRAGYRLHDRVIRPAMVRVRG